MHRRSFSSIARPLDGSSLWLRHIPRALMPAAAVVLGVAATGSPARAAYTIVMQQEGSNVVATGNGSFDLAGLSENSAHGDISTPAYVNPIAGQATVDIGLGGFEVATISEYDGAISGPSGFGLGNQNQGDFYRDPTGGTLAASASGTLVNINQSDNNIVLPESYVSGQTLSTSTATWSSETLSNMGVTPGTYAWTWGSGANADSFRLDVSTGPAPLFSLASFIPNGGTDDAPAFGAADPGDTDIVEVGGNSPVTASWSPSGPANREGYFDFAGVPQGDDVEVGLKFGTAINGGVVSAAEITEIVDYINANDGGAGDIASAYSSAPAAVTDELGAGNYDVLLSDVAGASDPYALYDFSDFFDDSYLQVNNVGLDYLPVSVPEPGSASLLAASGLGLLARRRRNKMAPECAAV
jgi:hypothetical protein